MNYCFIVIDNCKQKVYSLAGLISKKAEDYKTSERTIEVGGFYGFTKDNAENEFDTIIEGSLFSAISSKINSVDCMCFIVDLFLKESEEKSLNTSLELYYNDTGNKSRTASGIELANRILEKYVNQRHKIDITFMTRWYDYQIKEIESYNGLKDHPTLWEGKKRKCFYNPVDSNGQINNKVFVKAKDGAKDRFEYMYNNVFDIIRKEAAEEDG